MVDVQLVLRADSRQVVQGVRTEVQSDRAACESSYESIRRGAMHSEVNGVVSKATFV